MKSIQRRMGKASMTKQARMKFFLKPLVFLLCLLPLGIVVYNFFSGGLSANPLDDITDTTGTWTLRLIVLTLSITPLRRLTGLHDLIRFRRMVGLFAFFYGTLHFLTYLWFDKFFEWSEILRDIPKRPFITVGFASLVLMVPLAATSTQKMIRLLGGRRWNLLHRLIYCTGIGAVIHYTWLVKVVTYRQIVYALLIGLLLAARIWFYLQTRPARSSTGPVEERTPA